MLTTNLYLLRVPHYQQLGRASWMVQTLKKSHKFCITFPLLDQILKCKKSDFEVLMLVMDCQFCQIANAITEILLL